MFLENKVALITGASRGIGKAVALELAAQGADIIINYVGPTDLAEETATEIKKLGRKAMIIEADVTDSVAINAMLEKIIAEFGRVDILINNAGITKDNLLMRMKEEDWDAVLNINLKGIFNCTKATLKYMTKQKYGRIVSVSSVVGVMGNAGQANYAASKAGAIGFTKSIAKEVASRNITANCVAPGFIDTDMTAKLPEKVRAEMIASIPAKKLGTPHDVAKAIAFLASDYAEYITGQTLHVDGGMVM